MYNEGASSIEEGFEIWRRPVLILLPSINYGKNVENASEEDIIEVVL